MLRTITLTGLFVCTGLQAGFAAVSLSVNPVDGTGSLRFEKVFTASGNKKEIHIRVSSNGSRYQVFQRILEPVMNDKGDTLNLQALQTQTLANSNSYGTLYLQNADHLGLGDQLMYSSGQGGQSDGFMVGYNVDQGLVRAGGNFRGRMVFTVRGTDGSSDQVMLDLFLESSSSLKVTVKGGHNPARLRVNSTDISEKTADFVNVSFSGNTGTIRVYQELESMPANNTGQDLGSGVLEADPEGQTDALRQPGPNALRPARTLIYSSDKDADSFLVYFLVDTNQVQTQDAGLYTGKVVYTVETGQGTQDFPFNLECNIPAQFTMNISTSPGGVSFSHVMAGTPPQDKEVLITVSSNLHKPYQVLQNFETNMVNHQGKEFDSKYFTLQVEIPSGQKGQSDFVEFSPVKTGEYPIFSSDARGSGATFKVVYRLQGYPQMSAGDYLAPLRFSLNQK